MTDAYIAGIGITKFGRFPDESVKSLTSKAVCAAMRDCAINPERIKAAFFANTVQGALEGQLMVRGQIALRPLGLEGIPIINVENACASSATALNLALNYIRAGSADVVLAVGVDKMVVPDKKLMFSIFDGAWDVHDAAVGMQRLLSLGESLSAPSGIQEQTNRSFFMDVYAAFAKAHMAEFGTTQRQLAIASAKNHTHSSLNPLAQYQKPMSVEEVLNSPTIVWPYTLPMCAPVSDGAAAAVICAESVLKELPGVRPVKILSSHVTTGIERPPTEFRNHIGHLAAKEAYEKASVGPDEISFAEVHDATAFAEIQQIENLMFAPLGDGGAFVESGSSSLGGRLPINTSGASIKRSSDRCNWSWANT